MSTFHDLDDHDDIVIGNVIHIRLS